MNKRRGQKLLRAGAVFVLLAAVMPNVLYIGHGPTEPSHKSPHSHGAAAADVGSTSGEAHVQHCHVGAAKCAGPQSLVGTSWIGDSHLPPEPGLVRVIGEPTAITVLDPSPVKFLHPPQAALSS